MTRVDYAMLLHASGQDQVALEQLEQLVVLCAERLGVTWVPRGATWVRWG